VRNSCALAAQVWKIQRGVHPRGDGKSAEAIERERVVRAPSGKRVWKQLDVKELNEVDELEDDAWA
jgi:hypothetical protein